MNELKYHLEDEKMASDEWQTVSQVESWGWSKYWEGVKKLTEFFGEVGEDFLPQLKQSLLETFDTEEDRIEYDVKWEKVYPEFSDCGVGKGDIRFVCDENGHAWLIVSKRFREEAARRRIWFKEEFGGIVIDREFVK